MNYAGATLPLLFASVLLLPLDAHSSSPTNVHVTTVCVDCEGSNFAVYDDEVYLVVRELGGSRFTRCHSLPDLE